MSTIVQGEVVAKATGKTAAKSLEDVLWEAADKLRSKMDAAEYKHVVLGLIFLKYVSDVFAQRRSAIEVAVNDPKSEWHMPTPEARASLLEDRDSYTAEGVFWVPDGHRTMTQICVESRSPTDFPSNMPPMAGSTRT